MSNINLFALGGQDENGKNIFVLEIEQDIYVFNTGIKFPINDKWGVDGIIPDVDYLKKKVKQIKGIFITHAHDENFAALPWIIMDIPNLTIYGSKFTIETAKKRISKYKINHSNYKFEEIKPQQKIGNYEVKSFSVAASIPGALAYSVASPDGDIVFMSNAIVDDLGEFGKTDLPAIKSKVPNLLGLIMDSRRANFPGMASSKKSIASYVERKFKEVKDDQRIIFGAFDEEMYNTQEVINIANKYNRPIAFYGSAFSSLYIDFLKQFPSANKPNKVIDYKQINNFKNVVVLLTGTWSRLNDRFNRISNGKDVYMKWRPTDVFIMYTPPQNGMEVEYTTALDNITMIAPNITSIEDKDVFPIRQAKGDIEEITKALRPKFFLPVGSLYRYQMEAGKMAALGGVRKDKVLVLPNGRIAHLQDGELASRKGMIREFGDVIIQGHGVGDISIEVIKERKNLSAGGLVSIGVQLNRKNKQLMGEPNIQIVGVVSKSELATFQEEVKNVLIQKFESIEKFNYRDLQNVIRKRIQKVFFKKTGKEPLVVVTFYEV